MPTPGAIEPGTGKGAPLVPQGLAGAESGPRQPGWAALGFAGLTGYEELGAQQRRGVFPAGGPGRMR